MTRYQIGNPIADPAQHIIQPVLIGLGKIAQHVARYRILVAGMPNAQSHTGIIGANMPVD